MTDYNLAPATDIRKWLWEELQSNGILSASNYVVGTMSLNPIIPVQQQREFVDKVGGAPFITYTEIELPTDSGLWYIHNEEILFTVFCEDFTTSRKIRNLMVDLFRRQDESARDLNEFSNSGLGYLNISVAENRHTKPERSDTGRQSFDLIARVRYVRDLTTSGRFS
jgi:hypothetical protein